MHLRVPFIVFWEKKVAKRAIGERIKNLAIGRTGPSDGKRVRASQLWPGSRRSCCLVLLLLLLVVGGVAFV